MATDPPYSGTIYLDGKIITTADPSAFEGLTRADPPRAERSMYDRRTDEWTTLNAYLFNAKFDDGLGAEIRVNPEFVKPDDSSDEAAWMVAQKYAAEIGKLPTALRTQVQSVSIHQGVAPFGGGNNNLLIHTGQADLYEQQGILEETLVHEACHASLDGAHSSATDWIAAQKADDSFISTYARDYPQREDVAESFLCWLAVTYRSDRISEKDADKIKKTIPNRIAYFDRQPLLDMYPIRRQFKGTPIAGSWTYRIFNPTFVTGNQTPDEDRFIRADQTVLTLRTSAQAGNLEGTIEWPGGGLDLKGSFVSGHPIYDVARIYIRGVGRRETDGWEYRYQGHLSWQYANEIGQLPTLVGSVIRKNAHPSSDGGTSEAGEVFSFIAVKQQRPVGPGAWSLPGILTGSWTYRSFSNEFREYPSLWAPPRRADGLILQEGAFRLETPKGTIELPGAELNIDVRRVRSAEVPPGFSFSATGSGGETSGWEYHYAGHLTQNWPRHASSSGVVNQRQALVGSVAIVRAPSPADRAYGYKHLGPVGSVYPFIAVKQ